MKKYLKFLFCILIISIFQLPVTVYSFTSNDILSYISLEYKNTDSLPVNFRKTTDIDLLKNKNINTKGLDVLNASGSAQFTALSLNKLISEINKNSITFIDLRQESHGFINGNAISLFEEKKNINAGLNSNEVIENENKFLSSIPFGKEIALDNGAITLIPTVIDNENNLVSKNKFNYYRLVVTDHKRPTDETVDEFIKFINSKPKDMWLHFHCKDGMGRTTTFLAMYDMIKNSKDVSLEDIIDRQYNLGGKNLLSTNAEFNEDPKEIQDRILFIKNFYNYTKTNNDNFKTTWNEWRNANNIKAYTRKDELLI